MPGGALIQATDGNFYGMVDYGGANNYGTIFKITPRGTLTTLHNFDLSDGAYPFAGLVQATDGNFYGTTYGGGAANSGTIFKITPGGTVTTLYSFCAQTSCTDGTGPEAALLQATDGNFYGTTAVGGDGSCDSGFGCGAVFKITSRGALTTLHSFDFTDGAFPLAALVQATDGNFYGTTNGGGSDDYGTVFKITPAGTLTTLHSFDVIGGSLPWGVVQASNGNFYGTTNSGGAKNGGTLFSLAVGLGPFVETLPTSGTVGAAVTILGTNLTGATSVSFNGTAATFTVVSSSEITTTVPTGATTGKVKVKTPGATLSSNVVFRVLP